MDITSINEYPLFSICIKDRICYFSYYESAYYSWTFIYIQTLVEP